MEKLNKLKDEKEKLEKVLKTMNQKTDAERKSHIVKLLHEYNDVKDATQVLIGALANIENVTIKEIYKRLNLEEAD